MIITVAGNISEPVHYVANILASDLKLDVVSLHQPVKMMINNLVVKSGQDIPECPDTGIPVFGMSRNQMYRSLKGWGTSIAPNFWLKLCLQDETVVIDIESEYEFTYIGKDLSVYVFIQDARSDSSDWAQKVECMYEHDIVMFGGGERALEKMAANIANHILNKTPLSPDILDMRKFRELRQ